MKIAELSLLLFATLVVSSIYTPQFVHGASGTSFSKFPAGHQEFLSSISADAIFGTSETFSSGSSAPQITVGPNIQVNAPQQPPPAGRLGRSETAIAVGSLPKFHSQYLLRFLALQDSPVSHFPPTGETPGLTPVRPHCSPRPPRSSAATL
ncbi:hypothetical protein E6H30_03000 [Candidatus Bathyarchaeota archaeon]|nr:MAG: hypothetical protein E6H30_03000 [Candidatus Bathyarchaeota archaeon]